MKTVLLCVFVLLLLLVAGLAIHVRKSSLSVRQETLSVLAPKFAGNVWTFYEASNRFPNSVPELTDYVFGRTNWVDDYTFSVMDETQRMFSIGLIMGRSRNIQLNFQLSATGVVDQAAFSSNR